MSDHKYIEFRNETWRYKNRRASVFNSIFGMYLRGDKPEDIAGDLQLPVEAILEADEFMRSYFDVHLPTKPSSELPVSDNPGEPIRKKSGSDDLGPSKAPSTSASFLLVLAWLVTMANLIWTAWTSQ